MEKDSQAEQKPQGNWVPISKALLSELPLNRPYTRLEAMFSLTVDYDQTRQVSITGYSKLWQWSEGKVRRFLEDVGAVVRYPEVTVNHRNQRGGIMIVKAKETRRNCGGIKLIDSKWLSGLTKETRRKDEGKTEEWQRTTTEPNPKPNPKDKKHSVKTAVFSVPEWVPVDAWNGYVEMRLKNKKPMTDRAAKLVIAELQKLKDQGHDPGAVLDNSTKRNYTDVYPPKASAPAQSQPTRPEFTF